jgi:F0F1-type ATP synthase membrane subunit b/b'
MKTFRAIAGDVDLRMAERLRSEADAVEEEARGRADDLRRRAAELEAKARKEIP